MIDTLKYTKDLEAAGLNRQQAETIVGAQFKMISENVTTKSDLNNLELALKSDIKELRSEFKEFRSEVQSDFKEFKSEVKSKIEDLNHKFTLENQKTVNKLGIIVIGSVTALGVFLGLLIKLF